MNLQHRSSRGKPTMRAVFSESEFVLSGHRDLRSFVAANLRTEPGTATAVETDLLTHELTVFYTPAARPRTKLNRVASRSRL